MAYLEEQRDELSLRKVHTSVYISITTPIRRLTGMRTFNGPQDSSLLVFTTDAVASFQSRVWAYDFRANAPLSDREKIFALLKERNSR